MKLFSLRIEQLRQFRQPFELSALAPGLNLIHGPNESGKSTLVRAIRAAFFERYRSGSVDDLRPWGDSAAAPTIELVFDSMDKRWRLTKSFLQRKRCDLVVDGTQFNGEAAEEKLAELLGFQFSGRGASKPEHWGIPGLLWVEQGTGHAIEQSVEYANEHLHAALDSLLGEVASSGGDDVIDAVARAHALLLTAKGKKPRGEYAEYDARCKQLAQELADLEQRIESYQASVDQLAELRIAHELAAQEQPWELQKANGAKAEKKLAEIQTWQREQEREERALQACRQTLAAYREQHAQAEQQQAKLKQREATHSRAQAALEELIGAGPNLKKAVAQAQQAYDRAREIEIRARRQGQSQRLSKQLGQLVDQIKNREQALENALQYEAQLRAAREASRENNIDPEALAALKKNTEALEQARIRSESVATRISYELLEGKRLSLAGEQLAGSGERLLLDESHLELPGLGRLRISPGGEDVASLRRRLVRLEESQASQLAQLRLASLQAAEERAAWHADALAAEAKALGQLEAIAPQGVEALREQLHAAREDAELARAELAALPDVELTDVSLATAEAEVGSAETAYFEAERAYRQHEQTLALAVQHERTAGEEVDELRTELQHPDRVSQLRQLDDNIVATLVEERRLDGSMQGRQAAIDRARPGLLIQDVERYRASAEELLRQHQRRAHEIAGLQGTLQSLGAEGLEEGRDELKSQLAQARRRRDELHRRAQALDLLLELLRDKRQALTRRLQAPLQQHLDHYLGVLFPDAQLEVDERLMPGRFKRGAEHGLLEQLSFGAREQMGLISRLAYADLLKAAGRPTLLMLDDTLVHSDRQRRDQMKRILFDAAQRHQVLLFTCHPENWQDLGVAPRDLVALKATSLLAAD